MKLMIIDGNSIMNRAFYGIRMLNAPDGTPTNAVFGFLTTLKMLLDDVKPQYLCVCFDLPAPTHRHEKYEDYKAQRKGMPDDLKIQMPLIKETLKELGVLYFQKEGYEADDLIGAASTLCAAQGIACDIVTGDKDSFQLISDMVHVRHIKTRAGQTERIIYDKSRFVEEYGFEPQKIIDLKALMGDTSDNIPGVPGVGEKTAMDLIRRFGTVSYIYENLETLDIKDSVRKKLEAGHELAKISFDLATIDTAAPTFELEDARFSGFSSGAYAKFRSLGFYKLIEKWGIEDAKPDALTAEAPTMERIENATAQEVTEKLKNAKLVSVFANGTLDELEICDGTAAYALSWAGSGEGYNDLLKLLFSPKVKKISHNVKDLMSLLLEEGLSTEGFIFDTALAAYLLDAVQSAYEPLRLSQKYLGTDETGAAALWALYPVLEGKLCELEMSELLYEVELPLCEVLASCEREGFLIDKKALYEYGKSLGAAIDTLQAQIWTLSGEEFNINSPKQLGVILFEKLMLPHGKKTKTGWSTNADVLENLRGAHEIVELILGYRQLSKLKSTYADGLLKVIGPDGRIRTKFQMTVTATGRLSSVEPNLQNIPVRTPLGAELRKMFVASPGKVLVDADYSQIELRILAHISNDETMINAFLNRSDIHTVTASQVFGVPVEEVTSLMRSRAKAVNFGIVYGISPFSLAQDIGVFTNEAKAYIEAYLENYHGVREYMKEVVQKAKEDGFTQTIYGRRREIPELKSANYNMRSFGERVALNMPIQGAAADIIKIAMVRVHARLAAEKLNARLILQVHDELIAECPEAEEETVRAILAEEMRSVASLRVPLEAEAKTGKSWAEAH